MERERDEWQINALLKLAVKKLACMWCGEIVHAPTGYEPGTPLSEEQRGQAYREHVATCQKHPIRDVERERDEARKLSTTLADAGDEIRSQLREEQQLHVQTLNERDQWRNEHDRVVHEYQHRMMVIGMSVIDATSYPESSMGDGSPSQNSNECNP
jgi:hypothetical protein